jgi:hypothetical protein
MPVHEPVDEHSEVVVSEPVEMPAVKPPKNVAITFVSKDKKGNPFYRVSTKGGIEWGRIKSIIDADLVKGVPGRPVEQKLI